MKDGRVYLSLHSDLERLHDEYLILEERQIKIQYKINELLRKKDIFDKYIKLLETEIRKRRRENSNASGSRDSCR